MSQGFHVAHGSLPQMRQADQPLQLTADLPLATQSRRNRPLMADIARLAGVSIATVSRALSGDTMVAPATRVRVAQIAQSLHYAVDGRARGLRLGCNDAVCVIVPRESHPGLPLGDPLILDLLGSLSDALAAQGRTMQLLRPAALDVQALARDLPATRARGLVILCQGEHHAQLQSMVDRGLPFVVWGTRPDGQRYATVGGDNLIGGRLATGHLLDRGARRIAFVGDSRQPEMAQRHAGYLQAHRARGVAPLTDSPTPWPLPVEDPGDQVIQLVTEILRREPATDGFFAGSDLMAMAVVRRLRQTGRRVPEDVLVAGYGDTVAAAQFHPPLTSVCQATAQAGPAILKVLDGLLADAAPTATLLPARLHVRASSSAGLRPAPPAVVGMVPAQANPDAVRG